ncbi:MAG: hypothetical protein ACW972_03975 [Promethearchaeota archaeon]|jgi:hypothetical protein
MIQELMIINQAGLALFYYNFKGEDKVGDEQSLASYFDIICRFTRQNFQESLRILMLDSFIFFFYTHRSRYHLVIKCKNGSYDRKALELISESIIDKFLEKYSNSLEDFNGEISQFKSFTSELTEITSSKKHLIIEL